MIIKDCVIFSESNNFIYAIDLDKDCQEVVKFEGISIFFLKLLKENVSKKVILEKTLNEFDTCEEIVERDLEDFFQRIKSLDLIV